MDEEGDDAYWFGVNLEWMKQNDPDTTELSGDGSYAMIQNMFNGGWEGIGRDISNNSYLKALILKRGALNDNRMSFLFRGLTRSTSITEMNLVGNGLSISGVRSMVPFLQNANCLKQLHLDNNNIQSEGFNTLFRALRDSPIETLYCNNCGIESIEIDNDCFPRHFDTLCLNRNMIDASGCREVAKLLQGADSNLNSLWLCDNVIGDEGVAILVDALQNNISLETLGLTGNDDISKNGTIMLLKLVNHIASIKATLQSNHTLRYLFVKDVYEEIQTHINVATEINQSYRSNPERVGREKVIQIQLTCVK
jgi:Ran GTPase-activating protein (RanGAP) involved in mRNA processing and transport